jgi:hypothetical protein
MATPGIEAQREMVVGIRYLNYLADTASELRRELGIYGTEPPTSEYDNVAMRFVFNTAMPTFLLMKLGVVIEAIIEAAWLKQFPNSKKRRFHEQLEDLEEIHALDKAAINRLRELRNICAHKLDGEATWEQFDDHFSDALSFMDSLVKKNPT